MILLALAVGTAVPVASPAPALAKPATTRAAAKPAPAAKAAPVDPLAGTTPMAERVVAFAALNKRNGRTETFTAHPGEAVRFDTLTIRVRACETTPPWEATLTGAFLQIDETQRAATRRLYSGWMYAESASLHPLEHALYDVWVKSCTMSFPATGPDTVVAGKASAGKAPAIASSAKKSPGTESAPSN